MGVLRKAYRLAVIIPFFQRERGVLAKTIKSILTQAGKNECLIIIVDDGSPVPAKDELVNFSAVDTENIRVINQRNSGAGAARNNGLNNIPEGVPYVAFLDSDDCWEVNFVDDAVAAMEHGYDIFFANTSRFGKEKSRFQWEKSPDLNIDHANHIVLDKERNLYEYRGDFFDLMVVRSNIISTSTLVYRYQKYPNLRFSTTLYNGQDRLFKLKLCQQAKKVAFSPAIMAKEGEGVNIFDSSGWGSSKSLRLVSSYIQLCKDVLNEVALNPKQASFIRKQLKESRFSFIASLLHLLKCGKEIDWGLVRKTLTQDPATGILIVPYSVKVFIWRFFKKLLEIAN